MTEPPRVPAAKGMAIAPADRPRLALPTTGIWTGTLDSLPAEQAREAVAELEELGIGALWIPELAGRDPFVALALLLVGTRRIVGGTGIASIWARDPIATSCAAHALTEAFPDRIVIGLGVSHENLVNDLRGHHYDRPLSAMRDYLDGMDGVPYQSYRPTTPVRLVLAALRPRMLRLAAERTDGAHPYLVTPEHTASAREVLGDRPVLCPEQAVVLERDPETARGWARRHLAVYLGQPNYLNNFREMGFTEQDLADGGSDRLVDAMVAWGSVDQVLDRVRAHLDAGADHVAVQAITGNLREAPLPVWRELAAPLAALTSPSGPARPL
jgi:probable F420-dependent oxidoreductase